MTEIDRQTDNETYTQIKTDSTHEWEVNVHIVHHLNLKTVNKFTILFIT